jgi:hypothetical protein
LRVQGHLGYKRDHVLKQNKQAKQQQQKKLESSGTALAISETMSSNKTSKQNNKKT